MAIVNQGIGGNRVLTDGANFAGVNALARLDRDVLSQPGVQWLMMLEGINDIGNSTAQANNPNRSRPRNSSGDSGRSSNGRTSAASR